VSLHPLLSTAYRRRFVIILLLVAVMNFADRAVFSVLSPLIRAELHLSDTQIGLLQGLSFALLYGGLGIPIGRLAERYSRVRIIAIATAIWSVATAFSGMAGNYLQMAAARVSVGMGEAGFTAPTSSLVADHFPRERRASGMSLIMLGLPLGSMLGAIIAGQIAQHWGWRAAFFAFGVPGVLIALLTWFGLTEPPRGLADGGRGEARQIPPLGEVLRHLFAVPTLRWIVIGGAICAIGIQGVSQFMTLFLVRNFNLPISTAGAIFGVISGASLAVGLVSGAFGTDRASHRDVRWWVIAPAIALLITPLLFILAFNNSMFALAAVLLACGCFGAMIHYGPTVGLIQNLTPVNMRSSAAAVFAMLYALVGSGIGPTLVGFISDRAGATAFGNPLYAQLCRPGHVDAAMIAACGSAARIGLARALSITVLAFGIAAIFYWLAARTIARDLARDAGRDHPGHGTSMASRNP
jgi:predicted MFS family arabinose efflux permease